MRAIIGNTLISSLKPAAKPYEVRDSRVTGFIVRVQPTGRMVYVVQYHRNRRMTIGRVGVLAPAQARERAREVLSDVARGIDPRPKKNDQEPRLAAYIEHTYAPWVSSHFRSMTTLDCLRSNFIPEFGNKRLSEISALSIERWRTVRLKKIKPSSANRAVGTLKAALNRAVEWDIIPANPLASVKALKVDRSVNIRYLSEDEEKRLRAALVDREGEARRGRESANEWRRVRGYNTLPALDDHYDGLKPAVIVSLNTGLRRGELLNLKWSDIDSDRAMLTVRGSGAKSGQTRHVPLNTEALGALEDWRPYSKGSFVFDGDMRTAWRGALRAAGIKDFRWHDMRHHFASRLVMAGVDLNTVRELLGHGDIKMTLRYAHLSPEVKAEAVARLVRLNRSE
ncbi:MAG: site-specific integrase [Actinomycetota bacterium]